MKYITLEILSNFAVKLADKISATFVRKESGKGLSSNDYTTAEKNKLSGMTNYSHPTSGVAAGNYKAVTVNAQGHVTVGKNPTTLEEYGILDAASKAHTHENADILSLDAGKIKTGTIDIERLPAGALERCVVVANDAARFALTKTSVQTGDTVKVMATGKMYFVVDDTKLSSEMGYEIYTAGGATAVPWSGITDKPTVFVPAAHSHKASEITDLELATEEEIDNIIKGLF